MKKEEYEKNNVVSFLWFALWGIIFILSAVVLIHLGWYKQGMELFCPEDLTFNDVSNEYTSKLFYFVLICPIFGALAYFILFIFFVAEKKHKNWFLPFTWNFSFLSIVGTLVIYGLLYMNIYFENSLGMTFVKTLSSRDIKDNFNISFSNDPGDKINPDKLNLLRQFSLKDLETIKSFVYTITATDDEKDSDDYNNIIKK